MEFVQLTEAQRSEFEENGYLIVRSAIDGEWKIWMTSAGNFSAHLRIRKVDATRTVFTGRVQNG